MTYAHAELARFDPDVPLASARTPPSSWYLNRETQTLEAQAIFGQGWHIIGRTDQLAEPGAYFTVQIADEPVVVVRDDRGTIRAFFNVCRHHATCLVSGEGAAKRFVCPYHGWVYDLDGRLRSAPGLGAVENFDRHAHGLVALEVATWGPFVGVQMGGPAVSFDEWMKPLEGLLRLADLRFVTRVNYDIRCNWKVFVDNYLDGGYHVAALHGGLASQLDLDSYETIRHEWISIQRCEATEPAAVEPDTSGLDFGDRLQGGAVYAFVYPNFMINRYGPILDTNWVIPLGTERTRVIFDYYFETAASEDPVFVERSLSASDQVQREDVDICERVQRGLRSRAFDRGPYAAIEAPAHDFHCRLARSLSAAVTSSPG